MSPITSGRILVTGANGFVAGWAIDSLLRYGFAVRGTVRSAGKGESLKETFAQYGDRLEVVAVPDMTVEGAFDGAVKDVDAIIHIASPMGSSAVTVEDHTVTAVKGSTGILRSAIAHGRSIRRIIVTSSAGTTVTFAPKMYDETDWADVFVRECEQKGDNAPKFAKYMAGKVLAEKAVWELYEKNKAQVAWDICTIAPSVVFGPLLQLQHKEDLGSLGSSMKEWWVTMFGEGKSQLPDGFEWVDVRDVGEAYVKAITTPGAAGERIIVSAGPFKWQDWFIAARKYTDKAKTVDSSYNPGTAVHGVRFSNEKMKKILGIQPHSIEDTTAKIIEDFRAKGWLG